ncbi:hypothetical protein BGZ80_000436 [Entomortierella chlamydospora]|uniref:ER transporter 6TM N-terminal domain-containing protein n=1 Tax=Entomortierella chlamydospora TaxID=101097 RepID=A0A9P6N242_9FUNG|nr:hypothetical protein BGZ80_000436 [Entomortierella chlamydospora]
MPHSRAKQDSPRHGSPTNQTNDLKGHPLDSNHHNFTNPTNAIPRGNGYQAMSIPMPASSLVNFSLLSNNGRRSEDGTAHNGSDHTRPRSASTATTSDNRQSKNQSKNLKHPKSPKSDPSTPTAPLSITFNPLTPLNGSNNAKNKANKNNSYSKSEPNSRSSSTPSTPGEGPMGTGGYNNYHTIHHHLDLGVFHPLSMTHSQRVHLSNALAPNPLPESRSKGFDMSIFEPQPTSTRTSVDNEERNHRRAISRQPSMESFSSSNSVPLAPPPPPPPSAWKRFTSRFTQRVIKRHIKFGIALYAACLMILIRPIVDHLGTAPHLAAVGVIFMHPSRTVGAQLEITVFSLIGAVLAAAWVIPCEAAVAAFNDAYLSEGNKAAWAIDASWFFIGIWIMTAFKVKYAKLGTTFLVFAIILTFTLTKNNTSTEFRFYDFWNLAGPLLLGIGISQIANLLFWPETASENSSRALLGLSTRSFLLNHKTIALPNTVIEKAQAEVRTAQKKLFNAYREARYELTYSFVNPADYKQVRLILSNLMRHLGSMSLVVQNERILMLGHPDDDGDDLLSQSGSESDNDSTESDSEGDDESTDQETEDGHPSSSNRKTASRPISRQQSNDYFGTTAGHNNSNETSIDSPTSDAGRNSRKQSKRKSSAAELRRIRQLLQRAENATQAALAAKRQQQERMQKEGLQQIFQFDRGGVSTEPSTPVARGSSSIFDLYHTHRSKSSLLHANTNDSSLGAHRAHAFSHWSPNSSRPSSIHEEQSQETVKSFKSLFSVKSKSKFKPDRPLSLKAGFKIGQGKMPKETPNGSRDVSASPSVDYLPGIPLDRAHCNTVPARLGWKSESNSPNHSIHRSNGFLSRSPVTANQIKKAAESYRRQREKEAKLERKKAKKAAEAERKRTENEKEADAARLSDTCSRVMVGMERELVSGLSAERDRLERIKIRNAQRVDAIRAAEARIAADKKAAAAAANGASANLGKTSAKAEGGANIETSPRKPTALARLLEMVGIRPYQLTAEDIAYAEVLKTTMRKENERATKSNGSNGGGAANLANASNHNAQRNATSSAVDFENDFALPSDVSYVEYLTQELEIFDRAEAEGLRNFISTHPSLDIGPREELFLIFFFLFALREIACELLRLGKYIEKLEEQELKKMQEEHRLKPKKKLWWPKVMGNFWRWFSWGGYSQVKINENPVMLIPTKNIEQQTRTVEEEKAILEAKAVKAAAAKVALEKQMGQRRRRHSEMWDTPSLRRSVTVSALVFRGRQHPDLEQGLDRPRLEPQRRSREHRSRSVSADLNNVRSRSHTSLRNRLSHRFWHHETDFDNGNNTDSVQPQPDSGDPMINKVLTRQLGDHTTQTPVETSPGASSSTKKKSKLAEQYTVAEIPRFKVLHHKADKSLKHFEDINLVDLNPRVNAIKLHGTAPPELDIARSSGLTELHKFNDAARSGEDVTSTQSVALQDHDDIGIRPLRHTTNLSDSDNDHHGGTECEGSDMSHRSLDSQYHNPENSKPRSHGIFGVFNRRDKLDASDSPLKKQKRDQSPALEPSVSPKTMTVVVKRPKRFRYRVWEFLQPFKSDAIKFGFKMALSLTLVGLWSWLNWDSKALVTDRSQWSMMTVLAVLTPTIGDMFTTGVMRILGTILGAVWAIVTYLALPNNPYVIAAMMLPIALVSIYLMMLSAHPKVGLIMMISYCSIVFTVYEGYTTESIYTVAYKRSLTVIVGLIVSIIVNSLFWPILARRQLRREIAVLIGRQGVLFAELINKVFAMDSSADAEPGKVQDDSNVNPEGDIDAGEGGTDFIERAAREEHEENRRQVLRGRDVPGSNYQNLDASEISERRKKVKDARESEGRTENRVTVANSDRLAFQHIEQQLQAKLMKIMELVELSVLEPKLKEEFPVKLYRKIVKCCQNILDRMVSMRMAAQLLSPEVRELISGSLNICRRDLIGALLLYFSVLSSSLASKSPLPPYLPSARMARLRLIYRVREVIAARQRETGQDHYTYIYYYAFTSALEEVIEELELLAILIKPLVGVTMEVVADTFSFGEPYYQAKAGYTGATQMNLSQNSNAGQPTQSFEAGAASGHQLVSGQCVYGSVLSHSAPGMINLSADSTCEAASGAEVARQHLQNQHKEHVQERQTLDEYQRMFTEQQRQYVQLLQQVQAQQQLIQQQQQQLLLQQQQLSDMSESGRSKPSVPKIFIDQPITPVVSTNSTVPVGGAPLPGILNVYGDFRDASANSMPMPPVVVMDESLLHSRHGRRYQEAVQLAQEASGVLTIEVPLPPAVATPAQTQVATGVTSSATASSRIKNGRTKSSDNTSFTSKPQSPPEANTRASGDPSRLHSDNIDSHPSHATASATSAGPVFDDTDTFNMSFGSGLIPEAPLPLHMIPMQSEQYSQGQTPQSEIGRQRSPEQP